jgi:hypothetical protein
MHVGGHGVLCILLLTSVNISSYNTDKPHCVLVSLCHYVIMQLYNHNALYGVKKINKLSFFSFYCNLSLTATVTV